MTRQPLHIRIAAALAGLVGFALIYTIVACQRIAAAVNRWETNREKETNV